MTRAGAVVEQMPVPSKVITERVREPGGQSDGAARQGEVDGDFSKLLSKLKDGAESRSDQSATDLPDDTSAPTDWRGVRHRTRDARMTEKGSDGEADAPTASDPLRRGFDLAEAALLGAPPKEAKPGIPATDLPETDRSGEGIVAILTAKAPNVPDPPSEVSQGMGTAVAAKAPIEINANSYLAAHVVPAPKGQLDQKDAVRTRVPADAGLNSTADAPKSGMPGLVVATPAKDTLPKVNVVRQEAHLPVAAAPTMPARAVIAPGAGGKLGTGSEAKGNESAALIDAGLVSTEDPASGAVPAPTQQIVNRIAAEITASELVDGVQVMPNQVAGKPVLKVLQIQLQPVELGTVSIRMELRDGGLELHVEAAKAGTAEIIRNDKDALSNLLRAAGYNVDASSIRVVEGDRTAASQQPGQQGAQTNLQSSAQQQYGGAERNAREHQGTGGSGGGDTSTQANRTDTHETNSSRASGGLYI